jgi:hypothetical protein
MANIKIPDLGAATTPLSGDELFETVQTLQSKKVTARQIAAAFGTGPVGTNVLPVAYGGTGRTVGSYSVFSLEIHVSKDGNDTTGDGTLINPVLTIIKALTLVSAGRNTVLVHPGTYTENPTVSTANVTLATTELTGANTQINGTLTLSAAARVSGLKMNNLTITGSGNTYISNCTVDTQVIKSGSNYVEIINSELQCVSGVQISGAGTVSIVGNKCWAVVVNNASANVLIKDCFQVRTASVTAGTLNFDGCAIFAASAATNAVTSSVGTFITLANSFVLNSTASGPERVSLAGSYSILNLVYDKTNSTFAGTNLNAIDYFSVINADTVVTTAATVGTLTLTNDLTVANGGTGASTLTGYVKGTGTTPMTAAATIPFADVDGRAYISAISTDDQTGSVSAATAITFNSVISSSGITIAGSQITFAAAGTYMLAPSIQFKNTDTNDHDATFWFKKGGTNIANSASIVNIPKAADGGLTFAQIVYFETVTAGQNMEIMWLPENAAVTIDATVAGAIAPAIPSVILVAQRVA